jgi:hypothetical protein
MGGDKMLKREKLQRGLLNTIPILLIISIFCSCSSTLPIGETRETDKTLFRFVFLGDTRGDYKTVPPVYLAEEVFREIVKRILELSPKPTFVIFNGDMVAKTTYKEAPEKIERWQSIFLLPLQKNGIKIYTAPGNHILDGNALNQDNSIRYIPLFRKYFQADNPLNGPSIYKGVTYSFTHKNCHFVTVTPFITQRGIDNSELKPGEFVQKKKDFEYFINRENRRWLEGDLRRNHADFTIAFTHCPLYPVGPHYEDRKNLHAHQHNRDSIAQILVDNSVDIYLASHEHLYARVKLSPSNPASSKLRGDFLQVVVGSASAPLSNKPPRKDMVFEKYQKVYEFLVADVKRNRIEFNVFDEKGNRIDSFSIFKKMKKPISKNYIILFPLSQEDFHGSLKKKNTCN